MAVPLPPLRERRDDIPPLINHYIDAFNTEFRKKIRGVSPAAMTALDGLPLAAATCASCATPSSARCCWPNRQRAQRERTSRCCRRRDGELSTGHQPAGRRHQPRGARAIAGRAGARAQRLEPDQGGDAARPQPRSDPLSHRKVRAAKSRRTSGVVGRRRRQVNASRSCRRRPGTPPRSGRPADSVRRLAVAMPSPVPRALVVLNGRNRLGANLRRDARAGVGDLDAMPAVGRPQRRRGPRRGPASPARS